MNFMGHIHGGCKRKDLEITYSLRWKNGPTPNREDKEMSIISVYDIPATTLNFEIFKSYLLKNSGTSDHDVRVSYIMENNKEYAIQSQTDFQVALYAFRRKARSGELINLMLERISDQPIHKNLRHSNDVETQFDNVEQTSIVSTCCNAENPPEWFISCMAQLKKEITEDVTATVSSVVSSALSNIKPQVVSQPPCHHSRKGKPEKRIRKITPQMIEANTDAKDLIKSLKLENKLDKLEYKAAKYREKRLALQNVPKSSDSEAGHSSSRSRSRDKDDKPEDSEPKMDAMPLNCQLSIPHMLGGEIYMHQWEVENSGEAPWTSKTYLQYAWGSKLLRPQNRIISVPFLRPGDKGTISIRLQVPHESGQYECYWQFMHKDRRFGQWLGCKVIVDPFDLKGNNSVLDTVGQRPAVETLEDNLNEHVEDVAELQTFLRGSDSEVPKTSQESANNAEAVPSFYDATQDDRNAGHSESVKNITEQLVREVANNMERINLHDALDSDSNSSFYDNESLVNGESSSKNSSKDEFVMVSVPKCFVLDGQNYIGNFMEARRPPTREERGKIIGVVYDDLPEDKQEAVRPLAESTDKVNLEQAGSSGTAATKLPAKKALNTAGNNFDDNNNTEGASRASGNSIKLRDEDLDNIVVITVPTDEQVKEGFIYVHVDGQKVLIPKNILKSEVVSAADELEKSPGSRSSIGVAVDSYKFFHQPISTSCPPSSVLREYPRQSKAKEENEKAGNTTSNESVNRSPTSSPVSSVLRQFPRQSKAKEEDENAGNTTDSVPVLEPKSGQKQDNIAIDMTIDSNYFEANNYMSHCSAAGSCYSELNSQSERNNRLFIFPQSVPGYEVVHPVLDVNTPLYPNLTNETFPLPTSSGPFNVPPPANPFVEHVPNFQQTLPDQRAAPTAPLDTSSANRGQEGPFNCFEGVPTNQPANHDEDVGVRSGVNQQGGAAPVGPAPVHILPETLVSGAVSAASSAINTARSVINNMMRPPSPGMWVNGHWVSNGPQTPREANLHALAEMGFWNRDLNATLLARFNDDLNRVVAELVQ